MQYLKQYKYILFMLALKNVKLIIYVNCGIELVKEFNIVSSSFFHSSRKREIQ